MHLLITILVAFAVGFIGSMPLTGPVAVLVVSRSYHQRYATAFLLAQGAALAEAIYAGVAFWGFATFLARHKAILPITHAVSAVVLGAIGVYFARWKPKDEDEDKPDNQRHLQGFLLGFTVSALNPTLLATWSAAVAVLYSRKLIEFSPPLSIPFGLAAGAGVSGWEILFILLLRHYGKRFPRRALEWVVRGLGLVLIAVAVLAAVDFIKAVKDGWA